MPSGFSERSFTSLRTLVGISTPFSASFVDALPEKSATEARRLGKWLHTLKNFPDSPGRSGTQDAHSNSKDSLIWGSSTCRIFPSLEASEESDWPHSGFEHLASPA